MDDELLSKYLSGQASDEEIARLRAAIEADPARVDGLFDAAELERDLIDLHRRGVAAAPRRTPWFLLAAAVALLAVAGFLLRGGCTPGPPASPSEAAR